MSGQKTKSSNISDAVVRICPACGVVNPSGPSQNCPHLQLVKFEGLDDELLELIGKVAEARTVFSTLVQQLKRRVKDAVHSREADIESPRKVKRASEVEALRQNVQSDEFVLLPSKPPVQKTKRKPRKRAMAPAVVDSRQLELIASEPPKGHA